MKKVLLISISKEIQTSLEEAAVRADLRNLTMETIASFGQEQSWWLSNAPDVLCLVLPPDELMQGYYITKLKDSVPKDLPILLISPIVSANMMQLSQLFSRLRIVKIPGTGDSILKAVIDLTTEYAPDRRQAQPRYMTDQEIKVTNSQGLVVVAKMMNLSLTGAYFETSKTDVGMGARELMKIQIELGSPPREYEFDAKVVWRKTLEDESGLEQGYGYGVTFIDKDEVYNNLLKGF